MTLANRLTLSGALQTSCVALLCAVGVWSMSGLMAALSRVTDNSEALRAVHRVGHHLSTARLLASTDINRDAQARRQLSSAARIVELQLAPASNTHAQSLLDILSTMALEPHPERFASRASAGLAAVQRLSESLEEQTRRERAAAMTISRDGRRGLLAAGVLTALLSAIIGFNLHRSVTRPISALRSRFERLRTGRFLAMTLAGDREFRELAGRFNEMADQLRSAQETLEARVEQRTAQLVRSERLARLGVIAAGFAHEINNPLAIIRSHAELALRRRRTCAGHKHDRREAIEEMAEALAVAVDEADRASAILRRLQRLGADDGRPLRPLRLSDVVTTATQLIGPLTRSADCVVSERCACRPVETTVAGDESELLQVVMNLLLNALEAVRAHGGSVRVTCDRQDASVLVRVADDGVGMTPERLAGAFDPFVSGSSRTGLGLTVCQAIVERLNGRVTAHSDGLGSGSVFILTIPALAAEMTV